MRSEQDRRVVRMVLPYTLVFWFAGGCMDWPHLGLPAPDDSGPGPIDSGPSTDADSGPGRDTDADSPDSSEGPDGSHDAADGDGGFNEEACSIISGQGCPDGLKCMYYIPSIDSSDWRVGCVALPSSLPPAGSTCGTLRTTASGRHVHNCEPGTFCIGTGSNGTCRRLCTDLDGSSCADADEGDGGVPVDGLCVSIPDPPLPAPTGSSAVVWLCRRPDNCDVLCQQGCPTATPHTCYRDVDSAGHRGNMCYSAGDGVEGTDCDDGSRCAPGLLCVSGTCRPRCNLDTAATEVCGGTDLTCPGGRECRSITWAGGFSWDDIDVGVCISP
jgi:hypothetical protein